VTLASHHSHGNKGPQVGNSPSTASASRRLTSGASVQSRLAQIETPASDQAFSRDAGTPDCPRAKSCDRRASRRDQLLPTHRSPPSPHFRPSLAAAPLSQQLRFAAALDQPALLSFHITPVLTPTSPSRLPPTSRHGRRRRRRKRQCAGSDCFSCGRGRHSACTAISLWRPRYVLHIHNTPNTLWRTSIISSAGMTPTP
jgi:hypothetical protein